ncbi:MAG: hypothetical protein AAGJ40_02750 [Planctomycetota bacterium]
MTTQKTPTSKTCEASDHAVVLARILDGMNEKERRANLNGHRHQPSDDAGRNAGLFYTRLRSVLGMGELAMERHILPSFLFRWRFESNGRTWAREWSVSDAEMESLACVESEAEMIGEKFLREIEARFA